jgi:hypothetical protein
MGPYLNGKSAEIDDARRLPPEVAVRLREAACPPGDAQRLGRAGAEHD